MQDYLAVPRSMNRYFGQLEAFFGPLSGHVDLVDFMLLTFLKTFQSTLYTALPQKRRTLLDPDANRGEREAWESVRDEWQSQLRRSGVPKGQVDGTLRLLAQVFVPLYFACDDAPENMQTVIESVDRRKGAGHPEFFDRYFRFFIQSSELSYDQTCDLRSKFWYPAHRQTSMSVKLPSCTNMTLVR